MIGDFQNNYRSGWDVMPFNDDMPFNDFSREPLNLNFDYQIPPDIDDWPSSHHTSAHFADDNQLEYQRGHRYADDWPSSHHTSAHYADKKRLKDRKLARFCKRHLPRQRPECDVDKRQLPDQMPGHYSDKRTLPHQTPKGFAGKRNLPHQPPEDFADRRSLPHQKPEEYADNKCLPHRAPKPYSDKRRLPQQTPKDFADKKCLPHQTPGPTIPALAPVQRRQSNIVRCKICNVTMPHKCLEEHNNGKKHRMKLEELHEQSTEHSVPNGRDSKLFPNSSGMNPVVQPMKVAESKKNGHPVENVCREAPRFSNKEVPAVDSKLKSGDYAGAKDLDFKVENVRPSFKQKNVLAESSTRKLGDNTSPKDRGLKGENVKNEAPILKHKNVPAERSKRKLMDNTGAKDDGSKRDIMGAAGDKYMKMDNGVRRPVKSSKPETNAKSGSVKSPVERSGVKSSKPDANAKSSSVKSPVQRPGLKQPSGCVASPKMTPIPVEGSSFEIQSRHVSASLSQESKGNDQPQLVNASTGSNMTHTAGSMTNNQTEAALKVVTEPLASAPPDASASCFELLTDHGLHTEVEPQVSEAAVEIDAPAEVSTETEAADESSQSEVEMDVLVTVSKPLGPTIPAIAPVQSRQSNIICCKICNVKIHRNCLEGHNNGKKHRMLLKSTERSVPNGRDSRVVPNSSGMKPVVQPMKVAESKKNGHPVENVCREAPRFSNNEVPAVGSKLKFGDYAGAKDRGFKVGKMRPSFKDKSGCVASPETNDKSGSVKSLVQRSGLKQPSGCVASPKRTPIPVEGSSFGIQSQHVSASLSRHVSASLSQESKGKEHHKFQNIVEKNDQPQLVNASTGSNMTDTTGSMTNNQTEVVNSDYAAVKVVTEPDASASSFELLSERGLDTVVEPQVSEAAVEIDAPSEVSTETEAADESSQSEVEMDVLVTVSETTKLPQIPVCLTCGDVGFEETLVSCNKCKACALHRYCLDGPVIFTDEVIWFCEDCEPYVVVINDSDSESTDSDDETTDSDIEITDSEKGEVDSSKGCATAVTIADPQPISDPIWRGSLLVLNKSFGKIITGLLCHLSTLACPKVLEETKHLPNVLEADMIQREAVWPESFRKFGTNNLSIGLYFFPQNERDERYFDQLVDEMISTDLAMRARVDKAELLIFPSTMLPRKYKRFQSKYYLWGVYRRNQVPSKIHDAGSRNE